MRRVCYDVQKIGACHEKKTIANAPCRVGVGCHGLGFMVVLGVARGCACVGYGGVFGGVFVGWLSVVNSCIVEDRGVS